MMCITGVYLPIAHKKAKIQRIFFQRQLTTLNWSDVCYTFEKPNFPPTAKASKYISFILNELTTALGPITLHSLTGEFI